MIGKLLPKANFAPISIYQLRERLPGIYRQVSKEYEDTNKYETAYQSHCLDRVLSHLTDFSHCASVVLYDHRKIFFDEDDNYQPENIHDPTMGNRPNLSTLWRRAGVLVKGAEHTDLSNPPFDAEMRLFVKAVDCLVDYSQSGDFSAPVSMVLTGQNEISGDLPETLQNLYRVLIRKRGRWVDFDALLVEVWGWNLLEGSEPVSRDSVTRTIARLASQIEAGGLLAESKKIDGEMRARIIEKRED